MSHALKQLCFSTFDSDAEATEHHPRNEASVGWEISVSLAVNSLESKALSFHLWVPTPSLLVMLGSPAPCSVACAYWMKGRQCI